MKQKYFIDSHKGITFLFILFLLYFYNAWDNMTILIYFALHGSYGILWILKSYIFPDRQWELQCSLWYGLLIWFGLALYWITPYLIIRYNPVIPNWYLVCAIIIYIFGVFFHFTSDMQKFIQLKYNPNQLITDGMFKKIRNINYLGELFIYVGFSMLAMHWIPIVVLGIFIVFVWIPNMIKKDKSLSRYENFNAYKNQSDSFFPFIW